MNPNACLRAIAAVAIGVACAIPFGATAQTYQSNLSYVSEPGDPMGRGQTMSLGDVMAYADEYGVWVYGTGTDGGYVLYMAGPGEQQPQVGVYENALGGSLFDPAQPRLFFESTDDARCEGATGRFELTDVAIDPSGYVERLRGTFEQQCIGQTAKLTGQVDIVKPAVEPLTSFAIDIDRTVEFIRSPFGVTIYGWFTATCNTLTGGTAEGILEQRGPDGTVVRTVSSDRMGCDADGERTRFDFSAEGFHPGLATFTVDAFVVDPKIGDAGQYVTRRVTERVLLRPTKE